MADEAPEVPAEVHPADTLIAELEAIASRVAEVFSVVTNACEAKAEELLALLRNMRGHIG